MPVGFSTQQPPLAPPVPQQNIMPMPGPLEDATAQVQLNMDGFQANPT